MQKDEIKNVLKKAKPYFIKKLGEYTHKRVTEAWYFRGLAFVKDDMGYLFGFNIGFFKNQYESSFNRLGMNVLVRTNGRNPELRLKYLEFFRENLFEWPSQPLKEYTSERGGIGTEFPKYRYLYEFVNEAEMVLFLKDSIDSLHKIYSKIIENPDGIFDDVYRAERPWDTNIVNLCKTHLYI
jgi:hypothetical protein